MTPTESRTLSLGLLIGILALVFIVLEFNRRMEELNMLNQQSDLVRNQATQAVQTQLALQTQVAYAGSNAAVEEWARTDGHYIQEGDLPVVPLGRQALRPSQGAPQRPFPPSRRTGKSGGISSLGNK